MVFVTFTWFLTLYLYLFANREAAEATGDEPEDADFDMPKIYEPVSHLALYIFIIIKYKVYIIREDSG